MGNCLSVACSCAGRESHLAKVPTPANTAHHKNLAGGPPIRVRSSTRKTAQRTAQPSANENLNRSLEPSPSALLPNAAPSDRRYTVFISHAGEDKGTIAIPLREKLEANGITAFVDEKDMQAGDDARKEMISAMKTAKVAVVVLSPEFVVRKWPMMELMCFLSRRDKGGDKELDAPVIIPFFYRLNVDELDHEPRFDRTDSDGNLLCKKSRFEERRENGEPEANVANIKEALQKLRGIVGIRNDLEACNESSYLMMKRREILLTELRSKVIATVLQEGNPAQVRSITQEYRSSQGLENTFRRSFPPSSSGVLSVLNFDSRDENGNPTTAEGWVKHHLVGQMSEAPRVVTIHGIGGVGKSTILTALTVNKEIREQFCDGIHVIRLGMDATRATLFEQICQVLRKAGAERTEQALRVRSDIDEALQELESWFDGKQCAILVDDIWVRGIGIGVLSRLCKIGGAEDGSSVVMTTREHDVATMAPSERIVRVKPREVRGQQSREMLFLHADYHREVPSDMNAINSILDVCGGLPVSLAVAGKGVKKMMLDMSEPVAWKQYMRQLEICRESVLRQNVGSYTNLFATFAVSIAFLDATPREENLGFQTRLSFKEMHRRLCVMQKQALVPCTMLKHLWGVANEVHAEMIARAFMETGLANGEALQIRSEYVWHLSLHDSLHDFAVTEAKRDEEEKKVHESLLEGYASCDPDVCLKQDGSMKWWSDRLLKDSYIHGNVCRHLLRAGRRTELVCLLLTPEWTVRQLEVNDVLVLKGDFLLGMEAIEDEMAESIVEEYFETRETLQLISEAITLSSSYVVANVTELWFQVYGRLVRLAKESRGIRVYLEKIVVKAENLWLRSEKCILAEPGGVNTKIIPLGFRGCSMVAMEDKERVACVSTVRIFIVNVIRGEIEKAWKAHEKSVSDIAIGKNGTRLVSVSLDTTAKVWDLATLHCVAMFEGHSKGVDYVTVMEDGKRVMTGSRDWTFQLWDIDTGQIVSGPFRGPGREARCLTALGDDELVITGDWKGTMRLWSARSGAQVGKPLVGHRAEVSTVAVSPDGGRIVSASRDNTVRIWDAATHEQIGESLVGHISYVTCVALNRDGTRLLSCSEDKTIRLWDIETGKQLCNPLRGHTSEVRSVSFLDDDDSFVSCSFDGTVRIWDVRRKNVYQVADRHEGSVTSMSFTPDGKLVVTGSSDGTLRVWEVRSGQQLGDPLWGHFGMISGLAVIRDGTQIVSAAEDGMIFVWDLQSRKLVNGLKGHTEGIECLAVTPNEKLVLTGSSDKTVRVWDLTAQEDTHVVLTGHSAPVNDIFISDDGKRGTSFDRRELFVWELKTGQCIKKLSTADAKKLSREQALSLIGKKLPNDETGSWFFSEHKIMYGEGEEKKVLATLECQVSSSELSPDRKMLCVGLLDGQVGFLKVEM